jgi:long-chain acyl-CoA synthetase
MSRESPRDLVRRGAQRHGGRTAVISRDGSLSYRDLGARTAALAGALRGTGVGPGVQVALALPNSVAYLSWYFGVLEAGGIVVPLGAAATPAEAEWVLAGSGIRLLVAPEGTVLPRRLEMIRVPGMDPKEGACLWERNDRVPRIENEPWTPRGIFSRQFSSGSTGRPKQMLKTEANILEDCRHFCETLGLNVTEVFLAVAPLQHSYGALNFLAAFFVGGCVSVLPRFLPAPVLETARRHRPTLFLATPPMIEILGSCALSEGDEEAFRNLKFCIVSTGRLSNRAAEAFGERFGVPVRQQYGSTETLSATIDLEDGYEEARVGRPYNGVEIGIFDEDDHPVPAGATGRVGIRSPAASDAYLGDPEATAEAFRKGFVFPGDVGYVDDAGRLYVLGRSDVINIGGYKVDRHEVESVIRGGLPVRDVIVLEGRRAGLPIVRAVVEADPARVSPARVIEICRESLSPYKVPARVDIHERLERDANGKVIRAFLED